MSDTRLKSVEDFKEKKAFDPGLAGIVIPNKHPLKDVSGFQAQIESKVRVGINPKFVTFVANGCRKVPHKLLPFRGSGWQFSPTTELEVYLRKFLQEYFQEVDASGEMKKPDLRRATRQAKVLVTAVINQDKDMRQMLSVRKT